MHQKKLIKPPVNQLVWAVLVSCLLMVACSQKEHSTEDRNTDEPNTPEKAVATQIRSIPFDPDAVYMERMYATSNGKNGPENLLDEDPATFWEAMPGAGPDEGVMLYFEIPVFVSKLKTVAAKQVGSIQKIRVYANGADYGLAELGQEKKIGAEIQGIFLGIASVEGQEEKAVVTKSGEAWLAEYPQSLKVGFAEIELYGQDGKRLKVRPLHQEPGEVTASSVLSPLESYNAEYLFDSNLEFGWAEGKDDEGLGESIEFKFKEYLRIEKIKIWNGYQRSDRHFESNARAKKVSFGLSGETGTAFDLADDKEAQVLTLPVPLEGNSFHLKIEDFYPGSKYKDLLLSELRFFDGHRWFALLANGVATRKSALQSKVAGTVLEKLLDRNVSYRETTVEPNHQVETRLVLRSNGSFVLYRNQSEGNSSSKVRSEINEIADGNWSIESLEGKKARVKIFGKLRRILERQKLYKGKTKSDRTRIFHEYLNISPNQIKGEKMIEFLQIATSSVDMVALEGQMDNVNLDLKYQNGENILKGYFYSDCFTCLLRRDVAGAMQKAEELLSKKDANLRFLVWSCYRPEEVQKDIWKQSGGFQGLEAPAIEVPEQSKGTVVELSLSSKVNAYLSLDMGSDFEAFGPEAKPDFAGLAADAAANRALLKKVMEEAGFTTSPDAWWRFTFPSKHEVFHYDDPCEMP